MDYEDLESSFGYGEDIDDFDNFVVKDQFYCPDTHLKSPLDFEPVRRAVLNEPELSIHQRRSLQQLKIYTGLKNSEYRTDIHRIIPILSSKINSLNASGTSEYINSYKTAYTLLSVGATKGLLPEDPLTITEYIKKYRTLSQWFHSATSVFASVVIESRRKKNQLKLKQLPEIGLTIIFSSDYIAIIIGPHTWLLVDTGYLMICDVFHQRSLTLIAADLYRSYGDYQCPDSSRIQEYYDWGDRVLERHGVQAYKILKLWEPMVIGSLQVLAKDREVEGTGFYNEMSSVMSGLDPLAYSELDALLGQETSPDHLGELFGLYRHWGHPYTLIELAVARNKEKAFRYWPIDESTKVETLSAFKQMICEGYYQRNGHWPTLDFSLLKENSEIKNAIQSGEKPDIKNEHYDFLEWGKVHALPNFDRGENLNILNVLQDKAASVELHQLKEMVQSKRNADWKQRRVLSLWLASNLTNPSEILKDFDNHGIDKDSLLIGLSKKERELGIIPRLFSLMPLKLKIYFGLTENLIARDFLPLVPECTMTDSLQTLQDKILSKIMWSASSKTTVPIFCSLDFEKWNLHFRNENTREFFSFLDEMYGFKKLISATHDIFEKCLFYYFGDGTYMKNVPDENYSWTGQKGGCEGLRQKGWTLITIALLKKVMGIEKVPFFILGQGDNQMIVFFLNVPPGYTRETMTAEQCERMKLKCSKIKQKIVTASLKFGLPLKPEETWMSASVFSYGKNIYYKGRPLRCTLKRLCRMFPYANEDYPSLETTLTSISAAAMSATACGPSFVIPYLMSILEARRSIDWHLDKSILVEGGIGQALRDIASGNRIHKYRTDCEYWSMNRELLKVGLCLGCNTVGGSPFSTPWEYLVRGFPDPVTSQLSYLRSLILDCPNRIIKRLAENLVRPVLSSKKDLLLILQDPLSLNIINPISITNILKRAAQKLLSGSSTKNELMTEMLNIARTDTEKLVRYFSTVKPFAPAVLATILSASVPGEVSALVSRFDKTRTLVKMAREQGMRLEKTIRMAELSMLVGWLYQLNNSGDIEVSECTTTYAQKLRDLSWGIPVEGVTIPFPLHLFKREEVIGCCSMINSNPEFISLRYCDSSMRNIKTLFSEIGPCYPYRGSETMEKISTAREWETTQIPSVLRSVVDLQRMIGWFCRENSNLAELLRRVFSSYSDADPTRHQTIEWAVSGNWMHRFKDAFRKHGGYLSCLPTPATHCKPNTNGMGKYSKGKVNVALHFQALVVAFMHVDFSLKWCQQSRRTITHFHLDCVECLQELKPNEMEGSSAVPHLTQVSKTSSLFVSKSTMEKVFKSKFDFRQESKGIKDPLSTKYQILAREIVSCLVSPNGRSIPANWLFNANITTLCQAIETEGRLKMLQLAVSRKENMEYLEFCRINLKQLWKAQLNRMSTDNFQSLKGMFINNDAYVQISQLRNASECLPVSHPPSLSDLNGMLKNLLLSPWETIKYDSVIAQGEMSPVVLHDYVAARTLIAYDRVLKPSVLGYLFRIRSNLRSLMFTPGAKIVPTHLIYFASTCKLNYSGSEINLIFEIYKDIVVNQLNCIPMIKDLLIKEAPDEELIIMTNRRQIIVSRIYPKNIRYWAAGALVKSEIFVRRVRSDNISVGLSTKHGPGLFSLLTEADNITDSLIIGDGSGGTSLAISLRFGLSQLRIVPYFSDSDTMADLVEALPPDLQKHNPLAKTMVLNNGVGDIHNSNFAELSDIPCQQVVVDCDFLTSDITLLNNILYISRGKKLFLYLDNYSEHSVSTILSVVSPAMEKLELRQSQIKGEHSYLIVGKVLGLTEESSQLLIFERCNEERYSYQQVESILLSRVDDVMIQYCRSLDWIIIGTEVEALRSLVLDPSQFVYSSHALQSKVITGKGIYLNQEVAKKYYVLLWMLILCGNVENRYKKIPEEGELITMTKVGGQPRLFVSSRSFKHHEREILRKQYPGTFTYQMVEGFKSGSIAKAVYKGFLGKQYKEELDHQRCEGKCNKLASLRNIASIIIGLTGNEGFPDF